VFESGFIPSCRVEIRISKDSIEIVIAKMQKSAIGIELQMFITCLINAFILRLAGWLIVKF